MQNNNNSQFFDTREETSRWLDKYQVENYTINDDLTVDVDGDVFLYNQGLRVMPIKFGKVSGSFWCQRNSLTTLIGSPETVDRHFDCSLNKITTLTGSSKNVGGSFCCNNNKLINLTSRPESIGGNFDCTGNQLISLLEVINCNFKKDFYFSIDEQNFKPKELIERLQKYYNNLQGCYGLTDHQFQDIIKSVLEKNILLQDIYSSKIKAQIKKSFI